MWNSVLISAFLHVRGRGLWKKDWCAIPNESNIFRVVRVAAVPVANNSAPDQSVSTHIDFVYSADECVCSVAHDFRGVVHEQSVSDINAFLCHNIVHTLLKFGSVKKIYDILSIVVIVMCCAYAALGNPHVGDRRQWKSVWF